MTNASKNQPPAKANPAQGKTSAKNADAAETARYTVVGTPIYHDTKRYDVGDEIELTEHQAKRVSQLLEPVADSKTDTADPGAATA